MKMPSTYISLLLLLLGGLMFVFLHRPCKTRRSPVNVDTNQVRVQPAKHRLREKVDECGFSFFRDVISNIAPALKNIK
jgi:hypothetical protein